MNNISSELCIKCKGGRALCGWNEKTPDGRHVPFCPLLAKLNISPEMQNIGESFSGPSASVFIGRVGYPDVFVGPMAADFVEPAPSALFGEDYGKIISMRSSILRSKNKENIFSRSTNVEKIQEIALAKKPAEIELQFKGKPVYKMTFSSMTQPMGPSVTIKKLSLQSNVKIDRKVDSIVNDELLAQEQAIMLYKSGQDLYKITNILSTGVLGMDKNKKMVPTRYSITATDDIVTKQLLEDVRGFRSINDYLVFSSEYLGNHFEILFMPGSWEYEGFESWSPGSFWSASLRSTMTVEEYEPYEGRKSYADKQGGGYYAARFGVVEALHKMKRQARVVVFREISEKYIIPLGVWVVRETVRNAFKNKAKKFTTLDGALTHVGTKLKIPINNYWKQSRILQQKKLFDFLK